MGWLTMTYSQMPKSQAAPAGMKTIAGDTDNLRGVLPEDVVYAVKDGRELHLRMIYPQSVFSEEKAEKYPVLVHVQGSAWFTQNMKDHIMDMKEFVAAGFVVAIVQYRDSLITKIPGQVHDAKDAVRYIAAHADELKIDADAIFVSGDSSGGHTCAMCWATWPVAGLLDEDSQRKEPLPAVKAFLDFYGPTDLLAMTTQTSAMDHTAKECPESMAMGCQAIDPTMAERVRECSVLTYVDPAVKNAPIRIFHGNKDRLVPFEQSALLYEAARDTGKDVEFYCVDGADHGGAAFYCKALYEVIIPYMKSLL